MSAIQKLTTLLLCILLSSCFPIMRVAYGIKKPKPKSKAEIIKATVDIGLDTTSAYALSPYGMYLYKNQFKKEDSSLSVNQFHIIDKNQKLLLPEEQPDCPSDITNFIDDFIQGDSIVSSETPLAFINHEKAIGSVFRSNPDISSYFEDYDYIAFVTWASFAGRLNKESSFVWIDKLNQIENKKVKVISLNLDLKAKKP